MSWTAYAGRRGPAVRESAAEQTHLSKGTLADTAKKIKVKEVDFGIEVDSLQSATAQTGGRTSGLQHAAPMVIDIHRWDGPRDYRGVMVRRVRAAEQQRVSS